MTVLRKEEWGVAPWDKSEAARFISRWHYSRSNNPRVKYALGLYHVARPDILRGVCMLSAGLPKTAAQTFCDDWTRVISLSRLALDPAVPDNGCTFLISRAARYVREMGEYSVLASYADTWQGHRGTIYRAAGWEYLGLTAPSPVYTDDLGVAKPDRANGRRRDMGEHRLVGMFPKHKFRLVL